MADEWRTSPHAGSGRGALYRKLAAASPRLCDGCHEPLAAFVGADAPVAREGVTCDVCHSIAKVDLAAAPPRFALEIFDMVKYGPLCDAKDHYFHRMGCSKLHESATLCGACHQRIVDGPEGPVPLYTTYQEWKGGEDAAEGWDCQDCHMPGVKAAVARGDRVRDHVPDHGFFGGGDLRKDAAKLERQARDLDGVRVIDARLTNYAGHDMPTGFPAKRVVLRAVAKDAHGGEVARDEVSLGRRLVDAAGRPALYATAVRVASDDRLKPREVRTVTLFGGRGVGAARRIEAELVWQAIDPALAAAAGVPVRERPIAKTVLRLRGHR